MPELAHIEKVVFLQSVDLFSYCRAEEILRIAGIARERRFAAGERIYEANAPADVLYALVSGMVQVQGGDGSAADVFPLQTFGVTEILSGRLRGGSATATAEAVVLGIEAEDFFDLLSNNVEIVKALFRRFLEDGSGGSSAGR